MPQQESPWTLIEAVVGEDAAVARDYEDWESDQKNLRTLPDYKVLVDIPDRLLIATDGPEHLIIYVKKETP